MGMTGEHFQLFNELMDVHSDVSDTLFYQLQMQQKLDEIQTQLTQITSASENKASMIYTQLNVIMTLVDGLMSNMDIMESISERLDRLTVLEKRLDSISSRLDATERRTVTLEAAACQLPRIYSELQVLRKYQPILERIRKDLRNVEDILLELARQIPIDL